MSELTLDMIRDFMKDFEMKYSNSSRQLVVQTGQGGMTMLNNAIKKEVEEQELKRRRLEADFRVSKMKVDSKITYEEWHNLKHMIKSPDPENLTVVESIIEQYEIT